MDTTLHKNYITTAKLNLDIDKIKNSCYALSNIIINEFTETDHGYEDETAKAPITTKVHDQYNLFTYNLEGFHPLYFKIQELFRQVNTDADEYYIQCWLNLYKQGDFINWHNHSDYGEGSWHGFYCIDCEPSKTSYRLPNVKDIVDIDSENNLLVINKSDGDWHRTWPWEFADRDRITIAFDIVPRESQANLPGIWFPI
tara:strand:- start:16777 stop:17373 length:597 start_codon:yes stop_codon:yes gene_type:complete